MAPSVVTTTNDADASNAVLRYATTRVTTNVESIRPIVEPSYARLGRRSRHATRPTNPTRPRTSVSSFTRRTVICSGSPRCICAAWWMGEKPAPSAHGRTRRSQLGRGSPRRVPWLDVLAGSSSTRGERGQAEAPCTNPIRSAVGRLRSERTRRSDLNVRHVVLNRITVA
jgi:hypothetical protein